MFARYSYSNGLKSYYKIVGFCTRKCAVPKNYWQNECKLHQSTLEGGGKNSPQNNITVVWKILLLLLCKKTRKFCCSYSVCFCLQLSGCLQPEYLTLFLASSRINLLWSTVYTSWTFTISAGHLHQSCTNLLRMTFSLWRHILVRQTLNFIILMQVNT